MIFMDKNLQFSYQLLDEIDVNIDAWLTEFSPEFEKNSNGYILVSAGVPKDNSKFVHEYLDKKPNRPNHSKHNSWIARCKLLAEFMGSTLYTPGFFNLLNVISAGPKVELLETKENSTLLRKEIVQGVTEYAPGKMIMHVNSTNLYIITDWKNVKHINEPNVETTEVLAKPNVFLVRHRENTFIIVSGSESFNIVNVKTKEMAPFISILPASTKGKMAACSTQSRTASLSTLRASTPTRRTRLLNSGIDST